MRKAKRNETMKRRCVLGLSFGVFVTSMCLLVCVRARECFQRNTIHRSGCEQNLTLNQLHTKCQMKLNEIANCRYFSQAIYIYLQSGCSYLLYVKRKEIESNTKRHTDTGTMNVHSTYGRTLIAFYFRLSCPRRSRLKRHTAKKMCF